jgi:mono/diheme cytochrome c family protein
MKFKTDSAVLVTLASLAVLGIAGSGIVAAMEQGKLEPKITAQATGELKPGQKVPSSNPLSGDAEAIDLGKRLYFTWCVQCHGPKANGESRFGKYAGNLTTFWRGYKEFVVIVKNGRVQMQMPPWKDVLDEDNINKIGAYLETLALEGANWQ